MPNITENYGLKKPLPEEFYDVNVQNENMDKIDAELKKKYDPDNKPTPADIGAYSKTESDTLLQKKADSSSVYTKTESDALLQKKADTTKKKTVTLSTNWTGNASPYTQTVTISGITVNSKVDLQPDATVIAKMADDGVVALYIANDNGTLTANAVGEKPTVELTIQSTITEVSA